MSYGARDGFLDRHGFSCNFWMPLQDTSLDMGCMEFIPHSHLGNLKPHHPVGHDPKVHTLETDGISGKNAVKCPLPAGGVTIHQPKTLHYTGPNNSDKWRRAWILVFGYALPEVLG
jgi:ectoine hydroxylase-related dioxygenase (phytanoyl-CoA dioxygenase family)